MSSLIFRDITILEGIPSGEYLLTRVSNTILAVYSDGNTTNNHIKNLKWGSHKENWEDKRRHGTDTSGERSGRSKLSWDDVAYILNATETNLELSKKFSVSQDSIRNIKKGATWK